MDGDFTSTMDTLHIQMNTLCRKILPPICQSKMVCGLMLELLSILARVENFSLMKNPLELLM